MNPESQTILALYGAVLSTIVFIWNIIKYLREERADLRVEVNYTGHHSLSRAEVSIKAINMGKRPLTVEQCGFALSHPSDREILIEDKDLPKELTEHQAHVSIYEWSAFERYQIFFVWVRDSTGRKWLSKKWPLCNRKWPFYRPRPELRIDVIRSHSETGVYVRVRNTGNVALHLYSCGLQLMTRLKDRVEEDFTFRNSLFPVELKPHKDYKTEKHEINLADYLIEYAYVMDITGYTWRSTMWPLAAKERA